MHSKRNLIFALIICGAVSISGIGLASARMQNENASQPTAGRGWTTGTVKTINGSQITVASDAGAEVHVLVQNSTRMLRVAPGQKDLHNATPASLQDVHAGDRVLVRGNNSGDVIQAISVVVMKQLDIAAKQEQEREDWQKHGVGGLVSGIDLNAGTVTISTGAAGAKKNVVISISNTTIIRRYAPDSVKFDDAHLGKLDEIKTGDQLRARGTLATDGSELDAEEVVSGSFRNIAGTISSVNIADSSIRMTDLKAKQPVVVKINSDSQLRKLPPMVAQLIARRFKAPAETGNAGAQPPSAADSGSGHATGFSRSARQPDLQQILQRVPPVTLAELQKGDAVMIVATEGKQTGEVTAIRLLSGVEPILSASPNESQTSTLLSPWTLGSNAVEGMTQ